MNSEDDTKKISLEYEARKLAEAAMGLQPRDSSGFLVDPAFHGQEEKLIEEAEKIVRNSGEKEISFPDPARGYIRIEKGY